MKFQKRYLSVAGAIVVLLLSIIPLIDLIRPGFPVTHDGQDHVARIANFYASLSEGNIVPRWAANLNWGYGHPILEFLYPFPSYVASLYHFIGFSFVDSTKLVFASAFIVSMLSMYMWASSAWGVGAGIVAAVLYGFAPYRFVDLYVRGAIGEHMAFVFPPLIGWGLWRMSQNDTRPPIFALFVTACSTGLLIISHNALSLMFLPVLILYGSYLFLTGLKYPMRFILFAAFGILFGFLLSAFYWVPAFFEGKYTLRDIVTAGDYSTRFVPWLSFLYSPWNYGGGNDLSKWLGAGQLMAVVFAAGALEHQEKQRRFLVVLFILLALTLFIMTRGALPLWQTVTLFQKFQFPWRFLSVSVLLLSLIGAVSIGTTHGKRRTYVMVMLCVVTMLGTVGQWKARAYKVYPESFFTGTYDSTTDTGESSPIWSVRFMEKRPNEPAFLFPPEGMVTLESRTTTERNYSVTALSPVRFIENTLYFPGWTVWVNGEKLSEDKLLFQDPLYRGLMTFDLMPGDYSLRFSFERTKLRRYSETVSLASFVMFVVLLGTIRLWPTKIKD